MAFQTKNITVANTWTAVSTGKEECLVQLLNSPEAQVYVGPSAPAASVTGHSLHGDNKIFHAANLGGSNVYVKAPGSPVKLAITEG